MNSQSETTVAETAPKKQPTIRIFGIGNAGINILEQLLQNPPPDVSFIAISTDAPALTSSSAPEKLHLESKLMRGLGTGGDPDCGQTIAEEQAPKLKSLCEGAEVIFILTGLGGGAGTGISPVLARIAREAGVLTLAFVTTPFKFEGKRRQQLAQEGLDALKQSADGVVCMPNQKIFNLPGQNGRATEMFKITNIFIADGLRGILRLLGKNTGLIEIHFSEVCALLRDRHAESCFAVAEAAGANRTTEVLEKLFAHPMLDEGKVLADSEAVLVSLMGGPDLAMAEVNRVMEQINNRCKRAEVIMGAAVNETFADRLAVTLIAARKQPESGNGKAKTAPENLDTQLLSQTETIRPTSRFVAPPPSLPQEKLEALLARKAAGSGGKGRKRAPKMRQTNLPLEIISKGRFDKSEPTIHKGEDLDVPTYIRRGIALN